MSSTTPKRKVRGTSLTAFERVKKTLTPRQQLVISKIRSKPGSTLRDLVKALGLEKNSISPRISELEQLKIIKDKGLKYYKGYDQPFTKWEVVKRLSKP